MLQQKCSYNLKKCTMETNMETKPNIKCPKKIPKERKDKFQLFFKLAFV